jgi:outer membrane protein
MRKVMVAILILLPPLLGQAQASPNFQTSEMQGSQTLPSAPNPQAPSTPSVPPMSAATSTRAATQIQPGQTALTLKAAESLALQNNPQISVARLTALAAGEVTREVRSALWPSAGLNLTGVDSSTNARITAGALSNSTIYQRAAAGVAVNQLITDFGRTTNLTASADLAAKAEKQNAVASKEQILLAVDQAFYSALQAHAILAVAEETVNARQTVVDQISALFQAKLRSQLDFSFANVNFAQAKLLLLDAQNNESAALATLSAVLGYPSLQSFQLLEDTTAPTLPPGNVDDLIAQALALRPEMLALNFQFRSDEKFQKAQRDAFFPTVEAMGVAGETPFRDPIITANWYGAVGVNVNVPIFNGFLLTAREREAHFRAQATQNRLLDLRNRISRDVRTSWLNANAAYQKLSVTQQLLDQANLSVDLAQTRYKLGLSSIVELTQAQLQQTQAQIGNAQAGYDYRLALAILQYQTTGI